MRKFRSYISGSSLKGNNKPVIFFICVIISSLLWFANALGKQYEVFVNVPVHYTNLPDNKVLVNAPSKKLQMKISGHGFALLRHRIGMSFTPINFDVKAFINDPFSKNHSDNYTLVTQRYISQISKQMGSEVRLESILPDTLLFQFDQILKRKKKVKVNLNATYEKEYFQSGEIISNPDSVWVTGPKKIIDTLTAVYTQPLKLNELKTTVFKKTSLIKSDILEFNTSRIEIEVPVSQFTEYADKVSISVINLPDSLKLVTFPGKVSMTCMVALNDYKNISPSSFIFSVDFKTIGENGSQLLVRNIKAPDHVQVIKFQPELVEFIVSPKK